MLIEAIRSGGGPPGIVICRRSIVLGLWKEAVLLEQYRLHPDRPRRQCALIRQWIHLRYESAWRNYIPKA